MPSAPHCLSKTFFMFVAMLATLVGAPPGSRAERFDTVRLKTIPLLDVVHLATARFHYMGVDDHAHREASLAEIAALDPQIRTLVWLVLLDNSLSEPSDIATSFIGTGFFIPDMSQALQDAGMTNQAAVLRQAATNPKPMIEGLDFDPARPETYRTLELGAPFGDKPSFEARLLGWIQRTPTVAAWCDKARAGLSDDDRLSALRAGLGRIPGFYLGTTMARWPEPYRLVELVSLYEGELLNGGIQQFISNTSGDLAPTTLAALLEVGLTKHAALLERAMDVLPQPYPTDRARRLQALGQPGMAAGDRDRRLYDVGHEDAGPITPALAAFVKGADLLPR